MDTQVSYARLNTALRQRNMLAVAALILSVATLLLAYTQATQQERIILTPTLMADAELSTGAPSADYLEQTMRDISNLFLNRHPHNLSYFRANILRLADSSTHGQIEAALLATERELIATQTSTVFYPTEIYVEPDRLYSEIRGQLDTYIGSEQVSQEQMIYAADWSYSALRLHLLDFYPIDREQARAKSADLIRSTERQP